jgi:RNA polymerase-binding protein DksA
MLYKTQETHLKKWLLSRQARLREEIREALAASGEARHRELAGAVHDAADDSVADLLADVNLKGIDRDARELAAVGAALERIRLGQYGVCLDCGESIGYARMAAQPTAARCIECEQRHDRGYAHEQGSTL